MKFKKIWSLFGVIILASSLVTGCGNSHNGEPEVEGTESGNESENLDEFGLDATTGASESSDVSDLIKVMTRGDNWMFATESNMTLNEDLLIQGELHQRNDSGNDLARKLALYAQIREENEETGEVETIITERFTLTVPNIIISSPNTLIQHGTVDGNVIVKAEGFQLNETIITGDLIFTSQQYYDDAEINGTVMGSILIDGEVILSAASESSDVADLVNVLTRGDNWMFAAVADMTLETDLIIKGDHHRRNDLDSDIARKLALHAQIREEDEETGEVETIITDEYTLTVPNIIVRSTNLLINYGTVDGNVIVEAEGFQLNGTTITGDLVFATQALMDDADFEEGTVLGEIRVAE